MIFIFCIPFALFILNLCFSAVCMDTMFTIVIHTYLMHLSRSMDGNLLSLVGLKL